MHDRDMWWAFPLVANCMLLIATFISGPSSFRYDPVSCALVAGFASAVAFISVLGFVVHDIGAPKSFAALLGQTILLNFVYTLIYMHRGMGDSALSMGQAFYFSVVTWTSLGYANRTPSEDVMIVTAFQAITGYVFLGLLISLLSNVVGRADSRNATETTEQ